MPPGLWCASEDPVRGPYWTTKELAVLKEFYPTGGTRAVAERINRSADAIRQAAGKYGIKADKSLYKPINIYIRRKQNESCKRQP